MAVSDCMRTCRQCGAQFRRTSRGQPTSCCSANCLRERKAERNKAGKARWNIAAPPKRRPGRRKPKQLVCCGCHRIVWRVIRGSKDDGKFCSRKCFDALKTLKSKEKRALRRIADNWKPMPNPLVEAEAAALRRIARYVERPRKTSRPCMRCGGMTIGTMEMRRLCGACKKARRIGYAKNTRQSPEGRARRKRDKAIRRMRQSVAAQAIDPIKVFERDKWRCHLCGCKTPRRLRGTYQDKAPEMDHIVSLADGGSHTWGNVACACRKCNGNKSARSIGQLGLGFAA